MRFHIRFAALTLLTFGSCFPFDAGTVALDGPYYLWASDIRKDMALYYAVDSDNGVGRVGATVFAAGWDSHHLIVKRHPHGNRGLIEYFIIDRPRDTPAADPADVVAGPFSLAEFAAARVRLTVNPALDFTVVLRDLQ
jgi:hypothetical protein